MTEETHTLKKEKQDSFEFGSTKCRHKINYWTVTELKDKLKAVEQMFENEAWANTMIEKANQTK